MMYYLEPKKDHRTQCLRKQSKLSSSDLLQDIAHYYNECTQLYLSDWCNEKNLAMHYGYWNSTEPYNHHQSLFNMNALLYEKAGIKATDEVLDAGCGVGGSSIWMAKNHGNKVTGITLSEKQVALALSYAQHHKVSELTNFELADYCATPLADESFDVLWALESSCHALDKSDFIKESYRLLRKGGRLVVGDLFMLQREFNEQQWQSVVTLFDGWAIPNLCTRDEFHGLLADCKFQNIYIHDISKQIMPSTDYMYKETKRYYWWEKLTRYLSLSSKLEAADYEVGFVQYEFFREGGLAEYCIFTATK